MEREKRTVIPEYLREKISDVGGISLAGNFQGYHAEAECKKRLDRFVLFLSIFFLFLSTLRTEKIHTHTHTQIVVCY